MEPRPDQGEAGPYGHGFGGSGNVNKLKKMRERLAAVLERQREIRDLTEAIEREAEEGELAEARSTELSTVSAEFDSLQEERTELEREIPVLENRLEAMQSLPAEGADLPGSDRGRGGAGGRGRTDDVF